MARKDFKSSPVMSFISQESIDKIDKAPAADKKKAPEGYKLNPEYIETKSKRVQLLVQPSVYEAVRAKAERLGISANEAINEALREYVKG